MRATVRFVPALCLCLALQAPASRPASAQVPAPAASAPAPEPFPSPRTLAADRAFAADRFAEALAAYLEESRKIAPDDIVKSALMSYRIGLTQTELRDFPAAERSLRQSLDFALRFPPPSPLEPIARQALGALLRAEGKPAEARAEFESVLRARQAAGDPVGVAYALADVGSTYVGEAAFAEAFERYARAETLLEERGDPGRGRVLLNAASVYAWLGRYDEALQRQAMAEQLCRAEHDRRCIGNALHGRAFALYLSDDFAGSRDAAESAVAELGDAFPVDGARALNNLGLAELALHHDDAGLRALRSALGVLDRYGDTKDRATVTDSIGTAQLAQKDFDGARRSYVQALRLWRAAGHGEGERDTLGNLGLLMLAQGDPQAAVFFLKLSVNAAQALRGGSRSLPGDLQRSLTKRLTPNYQILAGLLIDQGRFPEAQQVLRMLKEQELHEFLRSGADDDPRTTRIGLYGGEAASGERFERTMSLFGAAAELERLDQRLLAGVLSAQDRELRQALQARMLEAQSAFEAFLQDARTLQSADEARSSALQYPDLRKLQTVLQDLEPGAVIVQYVVLPDQLKILLTSSGAQRGHSVPVTRTQLYAATGAFLSDIATRSVAVKGSAEALYKLLVPPAVQADLDAAGTHTMMVAPDGGLRYVPFAALRDGTQWLADKYAIVNFTNDSDVKLGLEPIRPWRVRAFGMTLGAPGFPALPAVRSEVEHIVEQGGGTAAFDAAFTRDALEAAVVARASVLHLASHFSFVPGTEDDSYLLLGDGARLSLSEMKIFKFQKLDLLTLSACQTATGGGKNRNGVEIEGLAALMQRQGAATVLATLWSVDDGSTAQFMTDFYGMRRRTPSVSKAEAFRAAQRRLATLRADELVAADRSVRGAVEAEAERQAPFDALHPYAHPFYWAPFVLVGNWR